METIQSNIVMPGDVNHWINVIFRQELSFNEHVTLAMKKAGKEFFDVALAVLNDPNVSYASLISTLQEKTGLRGKELFSPIRAGLTAELHGPELAKILELMGIEKAREDFRRHLIMLQIHNTFTKQKELFKPLTAGKVDMYVCGITVYDYCHIGHARTVLVFDL